MIEKMDSLVTGSILIVDDTPANIGVLHKTLQPEGFKVYISSSGLAALSFLENNTPDLILLDVMMPGIDGFETCEKIKENERTKNIPIIFITAVSEIDAVVKGFQLGAMDYITKPFRQEEVIARVKTQMKLKKAMTELKGINAVLEGMAYESSEGYIKLTDELKAEMKATRQTEEKLKMYIGHLEGRIEDLTKALEGLNRG